MHKEIAFAWADKLESGEYEQDRKLLKSPSGFCCLGVLCDMYAKAHPEDLKAQWTFVDKTFFCHDNCFVLPSAVIQWTGMKSRLGRYIKNGEIRSLSKDNDTRMLTFPEIAKIIRENWEAL